ncbi:hypothetical protein [Nocardia camponoti]|uniref:Uncharacterized protein n=1 Tax=Nocardia camponoti TaxID=1616106 RepID=A0A917V9P0_9NOCA|nr:hypothetical protein [Nocardia camponoti]GGK52207.1 hypothetical protein GCM10011591_24910 [Nocardia camponoti]
MVAAAFAATTFACALVAFVAGAKVLGDSQAKVLRIACTRTVPIPPFASALNGLAAGLLLASSLALVWLLVVLYRQGAERRSTVPLTVIALVVASLFGLGAAHETIDPGLVGAGLAVCESAPGEVAGGQ